MLKILYAADNRTSSYYTLRRFLETYSRYYDIRVAGYSSSIRDLNANWNLDALLDFRSKWTGVSFRNSNYPLYVREIKRFAPDLILSDVEVYSSYTGLDLGIPVWQISPLLLYYAIEHKHNLYKHHSGVLAKDIDRKQYINYIINNSDKRLVLSHLGDLTDRFELRTGFEWVRPNYDVVESNYAVQLADCYYNEQPIMQPIDYRDPESIVTNYYNQYHKLDQPFEIKLDPNIKFLSQHLKMLDI